MRLLLGTKNHGKIRELQALLAEFSQIELLTYRDQPFSDVREDGESFRENALTKARQISAETGLLVLAEDAGLEVAALHGAPGVRSARFAGEKASDEENVAQLLRRLAGVKDRRARFVCAAVLRFLDGDELIAEGELKGRIALERRGSQGFGYDPIFIPEGFSKTLAELGSPTKNEISHRRRALEQLKEDLRRISS
jgi:XTP/dITP diphosphohydrolase